MCEEVILEDQNNEVNEQSGRQDASQSGAAHQLSSPTSNTETAIQD